jgi:probable F420-dependent oxidoreductase
MRVGIHLPQYGRAASGAAVQRVARAAEDLGFADVWVSDHVVHPAAQTYPSPYLLDALLTLGWAAAVTERVGLGTSVLVLPLHEPLWLAKALGSLDVMSDGRLTVGVGIGWSQGEFDAVGQPFHNRGRRIDEIIDILRACWRDDPVSFAGKYYEFHDVRVVPQPARPIPIWVGGASEAAYRRGVEKGDGFHVIGLTPEDARAAVARLRRDRPDESFSISLRTGWDPQGMDADTIRREYGEFADAGIQHVLSAPRRNNADDWLRSMEMLADMLGLEARNA